jgi:hypothetical protein
MVWITGKLGAFYRVTSPGRFSPPWTAKRSAAKRDDARRIAANIANAQLRRMNVQVLRCLRIRDPAISDQPNSFRLESRVSLRLSMIHLRSHKNT